MLKKIFEYLVVGRGTRQTAKNFFTFIGKIFLPKTWAKIGGFFKKYWIKFWKQIDRILGVFARRLLKKHTKIVKNKVFFFTQEFRYGCNPKYICEELLKQNLDVDIVWRAPAGKDNSGIPSSVRKVKAGSYAFYKEIFSSNVIVANSYIYLDQMLILKKDQTLIQTWHGSLGIKRFGKKDMKGSRRRVTASVLTGKMSDYCITNSSFVSSSLRNTYWEKTPMLEYGHPRNDIFFPPYAKRREEVKRAFCEKYKVSTDCHFVMYAPTFRDDKDFSVYNIDFARLISSLKCRFGGEWVLLLRFHPSLVKVYKNQKAPKTGSSFKTINVTDYIDMQELIAISDVGITDYSSWIYDFMLKRKPGFIYAPDIARYNNERGFCYPLETTPFPISTNNNELEEKVLNFDNDEYLTRLEAFLDDKGCVEDGHASERVVELIKKITGAKPKTDIDDEEDEKAYKNKVKKIADQVAATEYNAETFDVSYYIKGDLKTSGKDIITDRTEFKVKDGLYKKKIFLLKGDGVVIRTFYKGSFGSQKLGESIGLSSVDEENRETLFSYDLKESRADDKIIIPESGIYTFEYNAQTNLLKIEYENRIPKNNTYYIDGNFNKKISWNGVFKNRFILEQEDEKSTIYGVHMEKDSHFIVFGVANNNDYDDAFIFNGKYLTPTDYATVDEKTNLIKINETGLYSVSINNYSGMIKLEKINL